MATGSATVSLNQVSCVKSGQESAGQVGGSVTVVQPEEDEENHLKLIDTDLIKQIQDFQVIKMATEEQACSNRIVSEEEIEVKSTELTNQQLKCNYSNDELKCLEQTENSQAKPSGTECNLNEGEPVKVTDFTVVGQTEECEPTEITGGAKVSSTILVLKSETVEQIDSSQNKSNLNVDIDQIINSSTDYELEKVEQSGNERSEFMEQFDPSPDAEIRSEFMEQSDPFPDAEIKSSDEHTTKTENKNIPEYSRDSYGDVDGFISEGRQQTGHEKIECETVTSVGCTEKETDEKFEERESEMTKDGHYRNKGTAALKLSTEKIQLLVYSIVDNTKVAYKIYKDCSCNFYLQVVFLFVACSQSLNQTENTVLKQTYSGSNETFFGYIEQFVFVSVFDSDFLGNALPDPNLPGLNTVYNGINTLCEMLGVSLRQAFTSTHSGESEEPMVSVNSVPDSGVFSLQNGHPREVGSNVETLQSSTQNHQNRAGFTSILSSPLSVTIRDARTDVTSSRIEGIPALQIPCTDQLGLNEDNTDRKIRNSGENLTSIEGTLLIPDGNPTTWRSRNNDVQEAGNHVSVTHGANSVTGMASQLSSSVTLHSTRDNMSTQREGRRSLQPRADTRRERRRSSQARADTRRERRRSSQARADTFDHRWPHSHLDPVRMAEAGFYYTGEGDKARCFWCELCLAEWQRDDDPMVEHIRYSPDCEYIQSQLQHNPQNFGASNANEVQLVDDTFQNDDRYIGAHGSVQTLEGQPACSKDITCQYSFAYAQQVFFPHHAQQVGPLFFKTPRKCQCFGVSCEASGGAEEMHNGMCRYALHIAQNGRQHLAIERPGIGLEQRLPSPSADRVSSRFESGRQNSPHGERERVEDGRNHSEAIFTASCDGYSQQAESSGIQETGYQSASWMRTYLQEGSNQTPHLDHGRGAAGQYEMYDAARAAAIDQELVNFHLNSDEVMIVLSEGYSQTDLAYVVEAILREDGIITVDNLKHELRYIGARRQA